MKTNRKSLSIALGTTLLSGIGIGTVSAEAPNTAMAEGALFELAELSDGYMQLAEAKDTTAKKKEGSCGEGKCGGNNKDKKSKTKEGKCGEGKCGDKKGKKAKTKEGKCGEGKCGGSK
ncbi:MAG: hypothetical protein KAG10_04310 [Methylococcales bacterium]|nr:hypothetical protein [Methylococcales bacterium]MCK5925095.1 hypothetical protein [Methylococcales bacterium]